MKYNQIYMEKEGVIMKIPEGMPTQWLSNMAYERKPNGKLRMCLNPQNLNNALLQTYHRSKTPQEVTHELSTARFFTKLDLRNAFWNLMTRNG